MQYAYGLFTSLRMEHSTGHATPTLPILGLEPYISFDGCAFVWAGLYIEPIGSTVLLLPIGRKVNQSLAVP